MLDGPTDDSVEIISHNPKAIETSHDAAEVHDEHQVELHDDHDVEVAEQGDHVLEADDEATNSDEGDVAAVTEMASPRPLGVKTIFASPEASLQSYQVHWRLVYLSPSIHVLIHIQYHPFVICPFICMPYWSHLSHR